MKSRVETSDNLHCQLENVLLATLIQGFKRRFSHRAPLVFRLKTQSTTGTSNVVNSYKTKGYIRKAGKAPLKTAFLEMCWQCKKRAFKG